MIISNQDSGGFLPPVTTVFTNNLHHHQPPSSSTTQESATTDRAICKIRDVVTAATYKNPRRNRTRRNSIRWTAFGKRKISPSTCARNSGSETLDPEDGPKIKRLRKMEETATTIEQRYRDFSHESEVKVKEIAGEDNPSEGNTEADKGGEKCVGLKQVDQGEGERIGFKRLDDGALRIQMHCSCRKRFEILHNHIGCFYRLI
ncbi:hypothetical protein Hanom_Chr10g00917541 [Helianthus anomalus]